MANLAVQIRERNATVTHGPLPRVPANASLLTQLLQNLLGNAVKYCAGTPEVHVSAGQKNGHWLFSVRDNGIGIEPKSARRIFGLFQRLHQADCEYEGSGMGLAICKKIVQRHGGQIWVKSQPGKGSTFYFTIPDATRKGA